jgi:hypothetical protein
MDILTPNLICKHCGAYTRSTPDVARLTGKPLNDVVCPACSGNGKPEEKQGPGWLVRCNTCDWQSDDDGDDPWDEGPVDAKRAMDLARYHECEKEVEVKPPWDVAWHSERDFDHDGQPRKPLDVSGLVAVAPEATS